MTSHTLGSISSMESRVWEDAYEHDYSHSASLSCRDTHYEDTDTLPRESVLVLLLSQSPITRSPPGPPPPLELSSATINADSETASGCSWKP